MYRLEDPNVPVWMVGVEEVTQGPYTGWYAQGLDYALEYREGVWRVAETAAGGLRLDGSSERERVRRLDGAA